MITANRLAKFAAYLALVVLSYPAAGDDTEIYVGANNGASTVRPNIVFIIDTSGSMDTKVDDSVGVYDPTKTYTGVCDPEKIYWRDRYQDSPSCTTTQWFNKTANKCDAATSALNLGGMYQPGSNLAMWNNASSTTSRAWVNFRSDWKDHYVECKADFGVHGDGLDSTKLWAARRASGPWTTSGGSYKVDWTNTGNRYVLYSGNFLNFKYGPSGQQKSRLDVVKEVFTMIMNSTNDVNVAVMRFNGESGGYFLTPMLPLDDTIRVDLGGISSRTYFKDIVNALSPVDWTPLSETLYESMLFFRGESPFFGATKSVASCKDADGTYKSPMEFQCQKNFVVLLTDGAPTRDNGADTEIHAMPSFSNLTDHTCAGPLYSETSDDCLDELAEYMYKNDQRSDINGVQNVITYTIAAAPEAELDTVLLKATATKGGGKFFPADSTSKLIDAFTSILTDILAINTTFAAPAVTVNAFNRLTHREELYFALFRPADVPSWAGNIKRYKLAGSPLVVTDAQGLPAVDPNTGFFKATSQSWWDSTLVDGDDVAKGGAANQLALPRTVYTNAVDGDLATNSLNKLDETNVPTSITLALLGLTDETYAKQVVQWARGVDVLDSDTDGLTDDIRPHMGDPLHTQPVLVTYGPGNIVLFGSTNEGFVHAIDTNTGKEIFSFMPNELLTNLKVLFENEPGTIHPYGMDGPLALWINDTDNNGTIAGSEHVYLYASMRRGGRNIYALNVTHPDQPMVKWTIQGGSGDFAELGQTWSRPIVAKVKFGPAGDKMVLIFGGGYDTNQDNDGAHTTDTVGRAVFMVDAESGARLWWAGPGGDLDLPSMTNSIPSEVRVLDVDGDGYADRMYVGDMGGRIWRFDINISAGGANDFAKAGVIAELGQTLPSEDTEFHNRRFYYPPDVSVNRNNSLLNVAIGSGYRAHPVQNTTIHDRFFVLFDPIDSTTYDGWKIGDLFDYRSGDKTGCGLKHGFYIDMRNQTTGAWEGEKVLAESLTLNHEVNFTSFSPVVGAGTSCSPSQGVGMLYRVLIPSPQACTTVTADDITAIVLDQPSIPPAPQIVCTEKGCTTVIGPQTVEPTEFNRDPKRDYWRQR